MGKKKKKKKCGKGKGCGDSCISQELQCDFSASPETANQLDKLADIISGKDKSFDFEKEGEFLGEGGFGTAYLVDGAVVKEGDIEQIEIDALAKLTGSGVTPDLLGVDYDDGMVAMTLAPGVPVGELTEEPDVLRTEKFDNAFIDAMQKVHEAGVSHNDLHEENVFYDEKTGKVSIIDFGLAKISPTEGFEEMKLAFQTFGFISKNTQKKALKASEKANKAFRKLEKAKGDDITPEDVKGIVTKYYDEIRGQ